MRTGKKPLQLSDIPLKPHKPLPAGTDPGALRYPEVLGSTENCVVALLVQLEEDTTAVAAVHDAETAALRLCGDSDKRAERIVCKVQKMHDTLNVTLAAYLLSKKFSCPAAQPSGTPLRTE